MSWPWSQLGLPGPSGLSEVRHAYAEKLKTTHPEEDPEGFQRLHSAYQLASRIARQQKRQEGTRPPEPQTGRPPHPKQEEPQPQREEDFDFEEFLQGGGEQPRLSHKDDEEEERDFDFDELLQEAETPSRPVEDEEEQQDWDYDRLFAEGEAERAEERRRRGEERRRAQAQAQARARERQKAKEWTQNREYWQRQEQRNTYNRERQDQFRQEEERWQSTETILHNIEMMYNARAETEVWRRFFQSPMFQQNKGSLDLIFGLEDFVSTKTISQEVRLALFMAYNFDKGPSRPELRPLFQMLLPAWKEERKKTAFPWRIMLLAFLVDAVLLFALGPILESGLIPTALTAVGLAFIFWVVYQVVKTGTRGKQLRGQKVTKQQEQRAVILGIVSVAAVIFAMSWLRALPQDAFWNLLSARDKDPREQTCRYIEQDFGIKVESLYNLSDYYANDTYGNVFQLEEHPNRQFLAGPDGERDIKKGKLGYTTNLPEMMLLWSLKDFMYERKVYDVDALDRGQDLERWETSGTFLITLPEEDGEEVIDSLGELLEELYQEKWYAALPSNCQIVMCSREMEEGRIVLIRAHPATELYSAAQIRGLYEDGFAHSVCAQIIKELELDWDFIGEEGEHYTLTDAGIARLRDRDCFLLYGLNGENMVAMEYYMDLAERNIYCIPGNFWETGNSEEQLNFYRVLYWGDRGTFNLFYPWLRVN